MQEAYEKDLTMLRSNNQQMTHEIKDWQARARELEAFQVKLLDIEPKFNAQKTALEEAEQKYLELQDVQKRFNQKIEEERSEKDRLKVELAKVVENANQLKQLNEEKEIQIREWSKLKDFFDAETSSLRDNFANLKHKADDQVLDWQTKFNELKSHADAERNDLISRINSVQQDSVNVKSDAEALKRTWQQRYEDMKSSSEVQKSDLQEKLQKAEKTAVALKAQWETKFEKLKRTQITTLRSYGENSLLVPMSYKKNKQHFKIWRSILKAILKICNADIMP